MTSTALNLAKAQAVRKSGYKTGVHALPQFKQWFDTEYKDGAKTIQELRKEALQRFTEHSNQIPSVASLKSYVDNYLSETVKVAPYTPQYHEHVRKFDSYLKLIELAKELLCRYEQAKQREQMVTSRKIMSLDWAKLYKETLNDIGDIEIKLGIRQGMIVPANFQQFNINNSSVNTNIVSVEKTGGEEIEKAVKTLEDSGKIKELEISVREVARQRNLQAFGQETIPKDL